MQLSSISLYVSFFELLLPPVVPSKVTTQQSRTVCKKYCIDPQGISGFFFWRQMFVVEVLKNINVYYVLAMYAQQEK